MGLQRSEAGEVDIRVSVYRDGERLEANGNYDMSDYVPEIDLGFDRTQLDDYQSQSDLEPDIDFAIE